MTPAPPRTTVHVYAWYSGVPLRKTYDGPECLEERPSDLLEIGLHSKSPASCVPGRACKACDEVVAERARELARSAR